MRSRGAAVVVDVIRGAAALVMEGGQDAG